MAHREVFDLKPMASAEATGTSYNNNGLYLPRRHSWPEDVENMRHSTSGIFEPLLDQDEVVLRSSMTSRASSRASTTKKKKLRPSARKQQQPRNNFYVSEDTDSGLALGSLDQYEASSGSAAAAAAELLEGASLGSLPPILEQIREASAASRLAKRVEQQQPIEVEVVSARAVRKKRIAGIFQHYYPEGGWGYVILIVGFLVQVLAIGLQQSMAILIFPLSNRRYHVNDTVYIGKNEAPFPGPIRTLILVRQYCSVFSMLECLESN
jgi:hypothetical protein